MTWADELTIIQRYLRDPDAEIWNTSLLMRLFNSEQAEICHKIGILEGIAVVRCPPIYPISHTYDWEETFAGGGKLYQAFTYDQAEEYVCTYPWEIQITGSVDAGETWDGYFFSQPWEVFISGSPGAQVPFWFPTDFNTGKFIAWDKKQIPFKPFKEIQEQDSSWVDHTGEPQAYTRRDTESNEFFLWPLPSTVSWNDNVASTVVDYSQDMTTYTQVTPGPNTYTLYDDHVWFRSNGVYEAHEAYVYKDLTVGYITGTSSCKFGFYLWAKSSNSICRMLVLSNSVGSITTIKATASAYVEVRLTSGRTLEIVEFDGTTERTSESKITFDDYSYYYINLSYNDDISDLTAEIYTDSDYQSLAEKISLSLTETFKYRYLQPYTSGGSDEDGWEWWSGYTAIDMVISKTTFDSGYLSSSDGELLTDDYAVSDTEEYDSLENNVLAIYNVEPVDIEGGADTPGYPDWTLKYHRYGVLSEAFRANNDGNIKSLSDYWGWRKALGLEFLRRYKRRRATDRDYCMHTHGHGGGRGGMKPPLPRLPDTYPGDL